MYERAYTTAIITIVIALDIRAMRYNTRYNMPQCAFSHANICIFTYISCACKTACLETYMHIYSTCIDIHLHIIVTHISMGSNIINIHNIIVIVVVTAVISVDCTIVIVIVIAVAVAVVMVIAIVIPAAAIIAISRKLLRTL